MTYCPRLAAESKQSAAYMKQEITHPQNLPTRDPGSEADGAVHELLVRLAVMLYLQKKCSRRRLHFSSLLTSVALTSLS